MSLAGCKGMHQGWASAPFLLLPYFISLSCWGFVSYSATPERHLVTVPLPPSFPPASSVLAVTLIECPLV